MPYFRYIEVTVRYGCILKLPQGYLNAPFLMAKVYTLLNDLYLTNLWLRRIQGIFHCDFVVENCIHCQLAKGHTVSTFSKVVLKLLCCVKLCLIKRCFPGGFQVGN